MTTIVDTGPLVALLNRNDRHHAWARDVLDRLDAPVVTCEAVLSEACFLLRHLRGGQEAVLELVARDVVRLQLHLAEELDAIRALMRRYADVPMSLADACVVRLSEVEARSVVVTLDTDFRLYRRHRRQVIPVEMPPDRRE
jgi:predicted nucleic acid-binding protein